MEDLTAMKDALAAMEEPNWTKAVSDSDAPDGPNDHDGYDTCHSFDVESAAVSQGPDSDSAEWSGEEHCLIVQ